MTRRGHQRPARAKATACAKNDAASEEEEANRVLSPLSTAYDVLGIPPSSTESEIITAWTKMLRWRDGQTNHPRMTEIVYKIDYCYELLRDAGRRAAYDVTIGVNMELGDGRTGCIGGIGRVLLKDGAYGRFLNLVASAQVPFELTLPTIVVIGVESAGKSSLMERLAIRPAFPRGENFVTRMPVRMKMRRSMFENTIVLRCLRDNQPLPGEERRFDCNDAIQDNVGPDSIAKIIADATKAFILRSHTNDDGRRILTREEIEIEIRAPNVPDLELIDLPGLVGSPPDVADASLQLTRRYLDQKDTLALCVVSDQSDTIRGSQALGEVARKASIGLPARTIVVLTKVDMSPANPHRLCSRLADPATEIGFKPRAIIPVINRQNDEDQRLHDALAREQGIFTSWTESLGRDLGRVGLAAVLTELNALIETYMRNNWVPNQVRVAEEKRAELDQTISCLGAPPEMLTHTVIIDHVQACMRKVLTTDAFEHINGSQVWASVRAVVAGSASGTSPSPFAEFRARRLRKAETRMRINSVWQQCMTQVPVEELLDSFIDEVVKDDGLPVNLSRFEHLESYLKTMARRHHSSFKYALASSKPPDDLVFRGEYNEATRQALEEAIVDSVFEHVLVPMASQQCLAAVDGDGPCLELEEKPGVVRQRQVLEETRQNIEKLRQELLGLAGNA